MWQHSTLCRSQNGAAFCHANVERSQFSCLWVQQRWNLCWSCKQCSSKAEHFQPSVSTHYISPMSQCSTSEEEKSGVERIGHVICSSASARGFSLHESNFKTPKEQISEQFSWECQMLSISWKALLTLHPPFSLLAVSLGSLSFFVVVYMLHWYFAILPFEKLYIFILLSKKISLTS